jgi:hypothetical protein
VEGHGPYLFTFFGENEEGAAMDRKSMVYREQNGPGRGKRPVTHRSHPGASFVPAGIRTSTDHGSTSRR